MTLPTNIEYIEKGMSSVYMVERKGGNGYLQQECASLRKLAVYHVHEQAPKSQSRKYESWDRLKKFFGLQHSGFGETVHGRSLKRQSFK